MKRLIQRYFPAFLVLVLAATAGATPIEQNGNRKAPKTVVKSHNFDRRAAMAFHAGPRPRSRQRKELAQLRKELDGSLLESVDSSSGVTRSLFNPVGTLTAATPGAPLDIALDFARSNLPLLGLEAGDLDELEICDVVHSGVTGATHIYFCQKHQGLSIFNAQLHVNVSADGSILSVNNSFVPGLAEEPSPALAAISETDACTAAANHLGISLRNPRKRGRFVDAADLSTEPIEPELVWLPMGRDLKLVWRFEVHTEGGEHIYDLTVDAGEGIDPHDEGRVMTRFDRVSPGIYQVYELPVENPNHATPLPPEDGRQTVANSEDPVASPLGWHDTGSQFYTIMRGNNVHAYDDRDSDDLPPVIEPDCGTELDCSFPIDLTADPSSYTPAAVANLFYWTNVVHDIQYLYGFDEQAGNFQVNNLGKGGLGGDDLRAEAQDGSGINNANFTVTPEGVRPKIQMFVWSLTNPYRDGDLDAGIIVHEYGHGISTRLVGGPSNVSCLSNTQQPGEGLSDWWALVYTAKPSDTGADPRGIASYVFGQPTDGLGIRTQSYSTDPNINTHTYESIEGMAVPHGVGEVWGQAAWEVYWALVGTHGFDPDLYNSTGGAGNQRMMLYVNEGLKNTACSPTFTDVRDGIIQAAIDNYGGEDVCLMWEAFAAFGLGVDAVSGGPFSTSPTNGFQVPGSCLVGPRIEIPTPQSQLSGTTVTFEWTANGEDVTDWRLEIGSSQGDAGIYESGVLPGATVMTTATGLPQDGSTLFVRLSFQIGGQWDFKDYQYTASLGSPEITDPAPGAVLSGSDATFSWDPDGVVPSEWNLYVGSSAGSSDLFNSGSLSPATQSLDVTGLPTDGRTLYVRLRYLVHASWYFVDTQYTAAELTPELVSPTPGTVLPGSDVTFSWNSGGAGVSSWYLYLGNSPGSSDLYYSGSLSVDVLTANVTGLPTDGRTIYVRLGYFVSGTWGFLDYQYTAAELTPELVSPIPGTVLPGSNVTLSWASGGAAVTSWVVYVGSSPGLSDLYYSGTLTNDVLSANVTGLPTDGRTIYVRLRYLAGIWCSLDYQYTAALLTPELISPTPGTVLPGSNVTFSWTSNAAPVVNWTFAIGTSPGLSDLFYSGTLSSETLSVVVTGLPLGNSQLHVRLRYLVHGVWKSADYLYTTAAPLPEMVHPVPGTQLSGSSVTFNWITNGAAVTEWRLEVGSTIGTGNIFASDVFSSDTLSATVTGLPLDERQLFVRLSFRIEGAWTFKDMLYTAGRVSPEITSPAPGSVLESSDVTFGWTPNGLPVTEWKILVGNTVGAADLYDSGLLPSGTLSMTATALPADGRTLFVRLSFMLDGQWDFGDFQYLAHTASPEIIDPVPGTRLSGPDVTFSWISGGLPVSNWTFFVGNSLGSSDLYNSGTLGKTGRKQIHINISTGFVVVFYMNLS